MFSSTLYSHESYSGIQNGGISPSVSVVISSLCGYQWLLLLLEIPLRLLLQICPISVDAGHVRAGAYKLGVAVVSSHQIFYTDKFDEIKSSCGEKQLIK